ELDKRQPIIDPADDPRRGAGAGVGHGALLTNAYDGFAGEFVQSLARPPNFPGQPQVQRCWPLTDPPGGVVDRAVAGAEPTTVLTAVVTGLLAEWDAAQMRADADDDQPFRLLDPVGITLWIAQLRNVDFLRGLDLGRRAVS